MITNNPDAVAWLEQPHAPRLFQPAGGPMFALKVDGRENNADVVADRTADELSGRDGAPW